MTPRQCIPVGSQVLYRPYKRYQLTLQLAHSWLRIPCLVAFLLLAALPRGVLGSRRFRPRLPTVDSLGLLRHLLSFPPIIHCGDSAIVRSDASACPGLPVLGRGWMAANDSSSCTVRAHWACAFNATRM